MPAVAFAGNILLHRVLHVCMVIRLAHPHPILSSAQGGMGSAYTIPMEEERVEAPEGKINHTHKQLTGFLCRAMCCWNICLLGCRLNLNSSKSLGPFPNF